METIRFVLWNLDIVKRTDLDERSAAKEEAKHVGHDVIADHTGDGNDEPNENKSHSNQHVKAQLRDANCACEQTSARSPDHPLKQVMDDEVRLSHHDQQSHMSPTKLEKEEKNAYCNIYSHI